MVRGANRVLALGQSIGRGLALGFRLLQQVHQCAALVREDLRHPGKFGNGFAGFLGPCCQVFDLLGGAFCPLPPLRALRFKRCEPFRPGLRLALQPVMLGAGFRIGRPLAVDVVA